MAAGPWLDEQPVAGPTRVIAMSRVGASGTH
jgi:hypothetical protein